MKLLRVKEAAEQTALKEVTIRKKIARREIAFVRLGRAVRIPESEIERLIQENIVPERRVQQ